MTPAPFATARLAMRPLSPDDAPTLHAAYADAETMRWWSSAPHATLAETVAYLTPEAGATGRRSWAIVERDGGVIGTLFAGERRPGVVEIGYLLVRSAWGRGYAREAVSALIDQLFAEGNRRVFADTDPENAASIRLLEALGFRREGLLRAEWETHIGVRDTLLLGLLADEWRGGASS